MNKDKLVNFGWFLTEISAITLIIFLIVIKFLSVIKAIDIPKFYEYLLFIFSCVIAIMIIIWVTLSSYNLEDGSDVMKEKMKNILGLILWLLGLAIGVLAIVMAILLVSLPITNLSEPCRYLMAITLFGSGLVIVVNRVRIVVKNNK